MNTNCSRCFGMRKEYTPHQTINTLDIPIVRKVLHSKGKILTYVPEYPRLSLYPDKSFKFFFLCDVGTLMPIAYCFARSPLTVE